MIAQEAEPRTAKGAQVAHPGPQTRLTAILARLPADDAAWLAPRVNVDTAEDRRAARLARRDAAILKAVEGTGLRPCLAASELERDLGRYAATGWQRQETPTEPRRALLHSILKENNGKTLGWRQLLNIIDGYRSG